MVGTLDDTQHQKRYAKYYDKGLLDPAVHRKLVENMDRICAQARIPAMYVHTCPLSKFCDEADIHWVREFHKWTDRNIAGMAYSGAITRVEDRMLSIAGALVRNYIDAKVMTVQEAINTTKDDEAPMCSALLIPNFYLPRDAGGRIPEWQVSILSGLLMTRFSRGLQTVVYVADHDKMIRDYGEMTASHIANHYYRVE